MGSVQVRDGIATHQWDGTPNPLKRHPNPYQEYKRAYRRHFPYASRFAKLGYWTFTFYAVLYFVLYARDQQQMYQRLKVREYFF